MLAIATKKTNRLEIWAVDVGKMIAIMDLKTKILFMKWSPHDPHKLIALEKTSSATSNIKKVLIIDYKEETQKVVYDVMLHFSTIGWHPKKPEHYVYGNTTGTISVCHIETL